jgi:hypothetical protein
MAAARSLALGTHAWAVVESASSVMPTTSQCGGFPVFHGFKSGFISVMLVG